MFRRELKVLHVDDDAVDIVNLQRIFKKLEVPHELQQASNGHAALELMRAAPAFTPDVILLDLNMPILDGLGFLKELRSDPALQRITVFVLSTSDYPPDVATAYDHNVAGYLVKPLSPAKFTVVIERLLGLWAITEFP